MAGNVVERGLRAAAGIVDGINDKVCDAMWNCGTEATNTTNKAKATAFRAANTALGLVVGVPLATTAGLLEQAGKVIGGRRASK